MVLFGTIVLVSLFCWGPIPAACLWLGSEADYRSGNVTVGVAASFAALFVLLFGTLAVLQRLDHTWVLVRRAAGHDQKGGMLGRAFAVTAVIGAVGFAIWFFVINGPGYHSPDLRVP
ncbi:MAG TPA: hypothetical protein VGN13_07000 [Solirubrobacteraceae bacterium]|jgi:predicted secreted protein